MHCHYWHHHRSSIWPSSSNGILFIILIVNATMNATCSRLQYFKGSDKSTQMYLLDFRTGTCYTMTFFNDAMLGAWAFLNTTSYIGQFQYNGVVLVRLIIAGIGCNVCSCRG